MRSIRYNRFLLMLALFCLVITTGEVHAEWLQISGEKGFSLDYTNDSVNWWEDSFRFNQSLLLDLSGEFGDGYSLEGHLVDEEHAPAQLFLALRGKKGGLQFGDGDLKSYGTALTSWSGEFNGLDAYLNTTRHQLKMAYANSKGVATSETLVFKTGKNFNYLSCLPVVDDTLEVYRNGLRLTEGVDFQFDPFTGKLELLFYPETELQLEIKYQYSVSEVLGNRFLALRDEIALGKHSAGFELFGSPSQEKSEPILLGEVKQPDQFNLGGFFYGYQGSRWNWNIEYWRSQQEFVSAWNYLDNMEGSELKTQAFTDSTNPWNWFGSGTGSGRLDLNEVSAGSDLQHTRDGDPSLVLDYQLERTGDSAFILHDFGTYRDYTLLSQLTFWLYLNGEDVQVETQLITSENNYYFKRYRSNLSGWLDIEFSLDPAKLEQVGIPDLSRIRYLKIVISSPTGDSGSGQIFLAPLSVTARSLAEQRWAQTETSPGSMINVRTITETVPGESSPNQALQLDYSLMENGSVKVTYEPPVVMNIADYHSLKLYLNSTESLTLSILSSRGGTEYLLGKLEVMTYGDWQEYEIPLNNLPLRILERIESLSFKINGQPGSHSLKIDGVRVDGRMASDASAVKMKGIYQAGPWRNQLEYQTFAPGFQELEQQFTSNVHNLRNITQYQGAKWQFKTDVKTYQKEESVHGYPIQGNQTLIEGGSVNTRFSLTQSEEKAVAEAEGFYGRRSESLFNLHHQVAFWNFDYQLQMVDDSLTSIQATTNNSLKVRYERENWWAESQIWQEVMDDTLLVSGKKGSNFGFGYRRSSSDRFQFQGGTVRHNERDFDTDSYFWHSDLAYKITNYLSVQAFLKSLAGPEDNDGLTRDRQYDIWLRSQPFTGTDVSFNYKIRDWVQEDSGASLQIFNGVQTGYHWGDDQKIGLFYRREQLENNSWRRAGSRFGLSGDLSTTQSWRTQFSAEINQSDGQSSLADLEESDYNFSFKNSLAQTQGLYYWGGWVEGAHQASVWERKMLQTGWERKRHEGIVYGARFDAGIEDSQKINGFIWGGGGFLNLDKVAHRFRASLRYQTYADYVWKIALNYDYIKNEIYSFNLQMDFLEDRDTGDDLNAHANLRIFLR